MDQKHPFQLQSIDYQFCQPKPLNGRICDQTQQSESQPQQSDPLNPADLQQDSTLEFISTTQNCLSPESEIKMLKQLNINPETLEDIKITQSRTLEVRDRFNQNSLVLASIDTEDYEALADYFETKYKPLSDLISMSSLLEKQFLRLKRYKTSVYFGEIVNNQRQSCGILIQFTEPLTVYEGSWQNNLREGRGFQLFQNGNIYNGFFLNGKPDGFGTYKWLQGDTYMGQWQNGTKNGLGLWKGAKGDDYLGEWKDDLAHGYGVHKWINGDRYEGQFSKSLKHGKGKEVFGNGDTYFGDYQNGKPSGFGEYVWATGSSYKGQFQNGLRNGIGFWKKETNETYEGEWQNDRRCGQGTYTFSNGAIYRGAFLNNLKHGRGVIRMQDGTVLEGVWEQGQLIQNHLENQKKPLPISQEKIIIDIFDQQRLRNKSGPSGGGGNFGGGGGNFGGGDGGNFGGTIVSGGNFGGTIGSGGNFGGVNNFGGTIGGNFGGNFGGTIGGNFGGTISSNYNFFNNTNRPTKKEQSNLKSSFSLIKEVNECDTLRQSIDPQQDMNKTARKVIAFRLPKMNRQLNNPINKKNPSPFDRGPRTLQMRKSRYDQSEGSYKTQSQRQRGQQKQLSLDLKDDSQNYLISTVSPRSQSLQQKPNQIVARIHQQQRLNYENLAFHDLF